MIHLASYPLIISKRHFYRLRNETHFPHQIEGRRWGNSACRIPIIFSSLAPTTNAHTCAHSPQTFMDGRGRKVGNWCVWGVGIRIPEETICFPSSWKLNEEDSFCFSKAMCQWVCQTYCATGPLLSYFSSLDIAGTPSVSSIVHQIQWVDLKSCSCLPPSQAHFVDICCEWQAV